MIKNILNLGDAALYCDFGKDVNKETNIQVIRYFKSIQNEMLILMSKYWISYICDKNSAKKEVHHALLNPKSELLNFFFKKTIL